MGHERLGALPKTKRWREIVGDIGSYSSPDDIAKVASATISATAERFEGLAREDCTRTAFSALVDLARGAGDLDTGASAKALPDVVTSVLSRIQPGTGSLEATELVRRAASDAIIAWSIHQSRQAALFSNAPLWSALETPAGFCELARLFFGKVTERYLNYFLDREASAVINDVPSREGFQRGIRAHVAEVSHHSFETARIAQSFAAGWYTKYALQAQPTKRQISKFLDYSFHKLRTDLRREDFDG